MLVITGMAVMRNSLLHGTLLTKTLFVLDLIIQANRSSDYRFVAHHGHAVCSEAYEGKLVS